MKIYQVMAGSYDEYFSVGTFSKREDAEKYAKFKNKYRTPEDTYYKYSIEEIEVHDSIDGLTNVDDESLCVKIRGYIEYDKNDLKIKKNMLVEIRNVLKGHCSINKFINLDKCISVDMYINISRDEFDNFDKNKYVHIVDELKNKIHKMYDNKLNGQDICEKLLEEYGR